MKQKGEFFSCMDHIEFENYEKFISDIDARRKTMMEVDKRLVHQEAVNLGNDINGIKCIPNGRFRISVSGVWLECFSCIRNTVETAKLWIFFSGARTTKYPQFNRWSYYKYMNDHVVCIADPMLGEYEDLKLGWYYGHNNVNYRQVISEFVVKVAQVLNVNKSDIIFMGSSGGGKLCMNVPVIYKMQELWLLIPR